MNGIINTPPLTGYDVVVRSQEEFDRLIVSPTWLDAKSVLFVGDGGTLRFLKDDGIGIEIPMTVKRLDGINAAILEVRNYNHSTFDGAIRYRLLPTSDDYSMNNITIKCIGKPNLLDPRISGFSYCRNLINCTAICESDSYRTKGFSVCHNLVNCTASVISSDTIANDYSAGFDSCNNLVNCHGSAEGCGGYGFIRCVRLTACVGTGTGNTNNGSGFNSCEYMSNCHGTGSGKGDSSGFYYCVNLSNCVGIGNGTTQGGTGFTGCECLVNCAGVGVGTIGYGFWGCSYVNGCRQSSRSTTSFLGGTNTKVDNMTVVAS